MAATTTARSTDGPAAVQPRSSSLMRAVNADIRARLDGTSDSVPFFCECETPGCYQPLWLTPVEYDLLGEAPYVLAPGHTGEGTTGPGRPAATEGPRGLS